jgi:hypothetical protein
VPSTIIEPSGVGATVIGTLAGEDVVVVEIELVVVVVLSWVVVLEVLVVVWVVSVVVEFEVLVVVEVVWEPIVNAYSFRLLLSSDSTI